ncbi:RGS domain-containing protein [Lobosporangium transversale]|uniref:RGS domain-containing protein n=1 Tax=Lobosporangium transversale TaxID=64571 RepID=A0A1Y2GLF3_9FUNG|nr:RGS domain-containing protein [Lobosporangium transversale]ORZ14399.1 RGS domain-containing protein [Lobosporangium transversale]|eukprot:XP_021880877.1 RGS domain-containing protein [Lobosporangium transversale]
MFATMSISYSSTSHGPTLYQHQYTNTSFRPYSFAHPSQQPLLSDTCNAHTEDLSLLSTISLPSNDRDNFPSLLEILTDQASEPFSLDRFAEFLHTQYCYENLIFWCTTQQYKSILQSISRAAPQFNLHQSSLSFLNQTQTRLFSDLQSDMLAILETFILPDSPYEVNLSDTVRSKLLKSVTDGDYHPQVLKQASDAIIDLMKSSSYPLFVQSISSPDQPSSTLLSTSKVNTGRDRNSWKLKAKGHFRLVSKALKKNTMS